MSAYQMLMTALAVRPTGRSAFEDERVVTEALAEHARELSGIQPVPQGTYDEQTLDDVPTEEIQNFIVVYGKPGTGGMLNELLRRERRRVAQLQMELHNRQRPYVHMGQSCQPGWDCHSRSLIALADPEVEL